MYYAFHQQPSINVDSPSPPPDPHSPNPSVETISDTIEIVTSEPYTVSELLESPTSHPSSEPTQPEITSSETNSSEIHSAEPDLALVIYEKPVPKTLDECINLFRDKALKRVDKLRAEARTSIKPLELENSWEDFQKWLDSEFAKISSFSEATKSAGVQIVKEREEEHERIR